MCKVIRSILSATSRLTGFLLPPEARTGSMLGLPRKPPPSHVPDGTECWPPVPSPATRLHVPDCNVRRCWLTLELGVPSNFPWYLHLCHFSVLNSKTPTSPSRKCHTLKRRKSFSPSIFCPQGVPWLQLRRALPSALPRAERRVGLRGGDGEEVSACVLAPSPLQRGLWTCTSYQGACSPSTSLDKIDPFFPPSIAWLNLIQQKACWERRRP